MKVTKRRVIFFLLHALFSAVIPIVLVVMQYSNIGNTNEAEGFKITITGLLVLLFVFWVVKRLFIDRKLTDLREQCNTMIADLKTKQDKAELAALGKEIKFIRSAEAVISAIIPLLLIVAAVVAFRALEAQLIKLSLTLEIIGVSFFIGVIFNVLCAREVHAKNRGGE